MTTRRWCAAILVVATTLAGCSGEGEKSVECARTAPTDRSVARLWDEAVLSAIRTDIPKPPVHARNLYHASAAMWDAWAAYDPVATGVFVDEDLGADLDPDERQSAREEAISYAAYRILVQRYLRSPGAEKAVTNLDDLMASLCYDIAVTDAEGDAPAALGNRIAATILEGQLGDGSNEVDDYRAPDYEPVNEPLPVVQSGTTMSDPNRWQPLQIEGMIAQNGLPLTNSVQVAIGHHWGYVTPFALGPADADGVAIDPGPPPRLGDPVSDREFKEQVNQVIGLSAALDPDSGEEIDLSPAVYGNRQLGEYESQGRPENPVTGEPYPPNVVRRGDYGRAIAEYWADGPSSETPPGHWNSIANEVVDELAAEGPLAIGGAEVDRLEYDVKLYLALNGAVHDAAIAAWGLKGHYDSVRPISMVRYLGGLGQSSDPSAPAYDPDGLLLEDGLVEVVTDESSAPGERHAALADHVGDIAIRAWLGIGPTSAEQAAGVGWMLAVDWLPYQRPTFVSPAFAGYVSGHSTFSRAAATVLAGFTGSPYFPGGLMVRTIDELEFEAGPTEPVALQWVTYFDAADEAGLSRLYGGIHVSADDVTGRRIGADVGTSAWELAQRYYDGTAP
jgi:hypothetical protein